MSKSKTAETTPEVDPDDVAAEVAEAIDDPAEPGADAPDLAARSDDVEDGDGDGDHAEAMATAPEASDEDDAEDEPSAQAEPDPVAADAAPAGPFKLHRRARLEETEALLAWLLAAPADAPMELDASDVENVSTPYVLAIVGAARARAEAGSPAAVRSPSPAFVDAFSDLGLFGDLMKMEIRP